MTNSDHPTEQPGQAPVLSEIVQITPSGLHWTSGTGVPRDRSPYWTYLGKFSSKRSFTSMRDALARVADVASGGKISAEHFPWWELRYQHVERIKALLIEQGCAPATVNQALVGVRQVLIRCRRLGLMTADECANAIDVENVRNNRLPAGRAASVEEVDTLFAGIRSNRPIDYRNRALVALMVYAGLRRSEVVSLKGDAYLRSAERLRVIGKGNKERIVPVVPPLQAHLDPWVVMRGEAPGYLICRFDRLGNMFPEKSLSPGMVLTLLSTATKNAGVDHLSPHDLRRTLITESLDRGVDALMVSKIVGHSDPRTTQRYDRRPEEAALKAMKAAYPKE